MYINENHEKMIEDRGDKYVYIWSYERLETTLDKQLNSKSHYIRVKCPYCGKEYDVSYFSFKKGSKCNNCCNEYKNSFAHYIEKELGELLEKYWEFEKNIQNPYYIYKCCNKKFWIKCQNNSYHGSYKIDGNHFVNGKGCPKCAKRPNQLLKSDSFAQYHIDNTDPNFLEKYWSDKNTLDPWKISPQSHAKVWMKCQNKDYHDEYISACQPFTKGNRCPYCTNRNGKVHPKDSFGALYPEKSKYWDYEKNKKSPFNVAPKTENKYWFICEKCNDSFLAKISNLTYHDRSMFCLNCTSSRGEQKIFKYITDKLNMKENVDFVTQKTFDNLHGLRNGLLSYDFYFIKLNKLLEFQGEQHEHYLKGIHGDKKVFYRQLEHDKRKRDYASAMKIDLLEIWYWDFDDIEEILTKELDLIT